MNNYQYVPNPVAWIDPLGLCKEKDNSIPDDYDLAEDLAVYEAVTNATSPMFVEASDSLYKTLPGISGILHAHEFLALRTYTGPNYEEMNAVLRGQKPEIAATWRPVNSAATRALDKLAAVPGRRHEGVAFRGSKMTEKNFMSAFQPLARSRLIRHLQVLH